MIVNEPKKYIGDYGVDSVRAAYENRGKWYYYLVKEGLDQGLPLEFVRDAMREAGKFQYETRFKGMTEIDEFAGEFMTYGVEKVNEGEIVTLIGANGAGKSTTLNTISGLLHSKTGHIEFMGEPLNHVPSHKVVSKGLALVPEGRRIFLQMSVQENLDMGAFSRRGGNIDADMERVFEQFPRLKERRKQVAGTLSGGEQQMLAMGRALMSNPKLLMLDEPSMGLSPLLVQEIFDIIRDIHKEGMTILLVEQNAQAALSVADRGYVLETGKIVTTGTGAELLASPAIKKAYLGG